MMSALTILVLADPTGRYLRLLDELPENTRIAVGQEPDAFRDAVDDADVIVVGMGGFGLFPDIFSKARKVRWVHSLAAGVEQLLIPELIASPVPLTNARGVFAGSLGEFALTSMLCFAKDVRRMIQQQEAGCWEPFDVDVLDGATLGIIGYGQIGRASARLAKPFGMKVLAVRRRRDLAGDDGLADEIFGPDRIREVMAASDYVLVAAALTPETRGLVGEPELRAMKPEGVIMNLGRGPVIVEEALVRALKEKWIRGAALDVFDEEPLPAGHAFYSLKNVLLSPHCADHTRGWLDLTMRFFLENFERFAAGKPLLNVVDKSKGY